MTKIKDVFKETFSKTDQTVIEYGKSKTFYKDRKLTKAELAQINKELEEYRKGCFKTIYECNPNLVIHSVPINNYIVIEGEYCTWNEELLNTLPIEMLTSFANICEHYNNNI